MDTMFATPGDSNSSEAVKTRAKELLAEEFATRSQEMNSPSNPQNQIDGAQVLGTLVVVGAAALAIKQLPGLIAKNELGVISKEGLAALPKLFSRESTIQVFGTCENGFKATIKGSQRSALSPNLDAVVGDLVQLHPKQFPKLNISVINEPTEMADIRIYADLASRFKTPSIRTFLTDKNQFVSVLKKPGSYDVEFAWGSSASESIGRTIRLNKLPGTNLQIDPAAFQKMQMEGLRSAFSGF